jgi:hypothetical protein
VLLFSLIMVGVAFLLASAVATTATEDLSARVAWINLGVVGLLVAGAGNTFWLLAGRRAVGERRAMLLADGGPRPGELGADGEAEAATTRLVALRGATRFHRPDCPLVSGKTVTTAARARHEQAGRRPCGVCGP